ncbi:MAG: arsenic resistance N-acetyltransferase ArsN2 [Paludibacter sp.]|nr:arsenic resistance N-acetyltransferase ArsN2 [Paludibacter sp.]
MDITKDYIRQKLSGSLPGEIAHLKMAPEHRIKELQKMKGDFSKARKSAVMVLLFHENEKLKIIYIRRSFYVGIHAGQIAFPGGRFEESDVEIVHTAFREIEEEIGIKKDKIELLGRLSDIYVPPSNFLISIFVGYLNEKPEYQRSEREVAEIIEVDYEEFLKQNVVKEKSFLVPSEKKSVFSPYYDVANIELWGASAMVTAELLDILKSDNGKNAAESLHEKYLDIAQKSLIRVQYSCGGNSTGIDEDTDYIPIVPENIVSVQTNIVYTEAQEDDVVSIIDLLKQNNLPVRDLVSGQRIFLVAIFGDQVIGCVAVEPYCGSGILRSLAVNESFRNQGVGQKLLSGAEIWAGNNGIQTLYLLTMTASTFFSKMNWNTTDRSAVSAEVAQSSEFASVCPATAICMKKELSK